MKILQVPCTRPGASAECTVAVRFAWRGEQILPDLELRVAPVHKYQCHCVPRPAAPIRSDCYGGAIAVLEIERNRPLMAFNEDDDMIAELLARSSGGLLQARLTSQSMHTNS